MHVCRRFDPRRAPGPEWEAFGSYCFVLPLLELTEAEDCCLLAVTLAWDPVAAEAEAREGTGAEAGAAGWAIGRGWGRAGDWKVSCERPGPLA